MQLLPVAVISAAVLGYQVLLMRLFAIVQWHHFAYMIISIALLGFGASGTFLTLVQDRLLPRLWAAFATGAALFGVSSIACFALAERLPFNPLELVWDPRQLVWLAASYALLILPFFFGGGCIGLALAGLREQIGRVYAYDLTGAGVGALGIVLLLFLVDPSTALRLIGALGLVAAALAALQLAPARARLIASGALGVAALGTALWLPPTWTALHLSPYKGLSLALTVPGARIIEQRSSPLGLLSVVESPTVPFRHAPGLSLAATQEPPPQLGVFTDGDGLSAITAFDGNIARLGYLDFTTSALPYHLLERPAVLILGAGGGADVLQALYHGAARIDAVELDPQFLDLVRSTYANVAGRLYDRPEVAVRLGEARSFVASTGRRFDLVQLPLLDSFGAAAAGVHSLHESYIYTLEAIRDYLRVLRPGGMVAITRWLKLPPRDSLKLFATAVVALEQAGVAEPERQLALIRSWRTTTLLIRNGPFTEGEIEAIRAFAEARSFDLAYHPAIRADEANRFNLLDEPFFYEGARALVGPDRADYLARYKFQIAPATDDRPYFFDFFKWRALPELLALRAQGGAAMLDWGYLILFATLVQAALLSALLILLPLWLRRRRLGAAAPRARIAGYFLALGLAFLFIEIAFIQRFILFLGHPTYAIAVVLAGFLVFAGLGSRTAPRLAARLAERGPTDPGPLRSDPYAVGEAEATDRDHPTGRGLDHAPHAAPGATAQHSGRRVAAEAPPLRWFRLPRDAVPLAVAMIGAVALVYLFALPAIFGALMALPDAAKIALSLALIAPLAFFMGMPFPLGLARVAAHSPDLVPWAWAINGCASVMSAILATILAMHLGFTAVVALAVALYLAAAFSRP